MNEFVSRHGVRLLAVAAALVPVLTVLYPQTPWEALAGLFVALLGAGEVAQRHEDLKTAVALDTPRDELKALRATKD
ncbi:hypothetical protein ACFYW9_19235 [Streptomyces sp. NPDC002698]|uniref:hypothetical protein n=1 Tax=Streptomyces sp. NPDC002698 TaxID=3364660 RepID=UPI0036AC391E